jgi:hypothetical protein
MEWLLYLVDMNPDGVGNFGMSYVKEPFTIFSGILWIFVYGFCFM